MYGKSNGVGSLRCSESSCSIDAELPESVDAGRMAAVADDEKISVVVKPSLVRLDEDVRLRSEGGSGVEEVVLKANLSAVGRAPHQHLVLAQALDTAEERTN